MGSMPHSLQPNPHPAFQFKDRTKSFDSIGRPIHTKEIEESKVNTQLINHPQAVPVPAKFMPKDLISTRDLSPREAEGLLHLAGLMKARPADFCDALSGKQLVMFFEKASLARA